MTQKPAPTILLVDDDSLIPVLGQKLLESLGSRLETAGDGSEALKKFQGMGRVYLVVLDYFLSGQNSCEVLKEFNFLDNRACVLVASVFYHPRIWPASKRRGPWA
jgi:CheY-like chemotaxis protein